MTAKDPADAVREALDPHEAVMALRTLAANAGVPRIADVLYRCADALAEQTDKADRLAALAGAAPNIGVGVDVSPDGVDVTVVLRDGSVDTVIHHEHHDLPHAPAKAREEWQPIATAPKDERSIMLHMPGQLRPLMIRGDDLASGFAHWAEGATHWRPLPEPPAALAGGLAIGERGRGRGEV